jgi:hypothetical protein
VPLDSEGYIEDWGVFVFRMYTGRVFRCKATVDVMAKVFGREEIYFQLI